MTGSPVAIGIAIGAALEALLVLLLRPADVNQYLIMAGALAITAAAIAVGLEMTAKRRPGQQPPVKPPAQPPQPPTMMTMEDYLNRPQPFQPPPQPVAQPVMQPPQPAPQPQRQPVMPPFPLANGRRHEEQLRTRQEIPWQPAPWDDLAPSPPEPAEADPPAAEPVDAVAALLPIRPPTAADYEVIRRALADCDGSRRRACVAVYGRRDGQTYPWLRKVADYWDISEIDRPSLIVWELLGTREIPGNLAARLGLDLTADQVSEVIDYAGLTRCQECEQWCILDELDENDACTSCTA